MGIAAVMITGGEPLIRQDLLLKLCDLLADYPNTTIEILTNGTLLNGEFIRQIASFPNKISIQVSIDGAYPQIHDDFRGSRGSWEKAINNICYAIQTGIDVHIAHIIHRHNMDTIRDMFDLTMAIGATKLTVGEVFALGNAIKPGNSEYLLTKSMSEKIYCRLRELQEQYSRFYSIYLGEPNGVSYLEKFHQYYQDWMLVDPFGNVKLDCRLPYIVGNILQDDIPAIWTNLIYSTNCKRVRDDIEKHIAIDKMISNLEYINLNASNQNI
jgi:MoaA/NifB/PqqE/SkfB family radical SAM enzyme